ncbi:PSP1 domain-containing protein [Lutibacter flavus]|uniref:Cell fate regulator YaaT, PSP1 superfamily (Controls sporulation, competence, biofilm development) n=1 Tax=Lutibacter flavus TaxID=691689 RepID=A0A238X440_9FLAO|nr:regulatory iron-sulfur-containing complex subunit RicT [Lutibacter flavus]SNR52619.1 Cell fate regulator YaaT, PSP1 superfamily (controls sporulation, competence, biofilm development) [Lutibacter flavus]
MSCNSCSSDINSVPKGCKSNGSCGTGDCDKLSVFDWLSNMALPTGQDPVNIVEVRFKNGRKHFFRNQDNLQISIGDIIAVEGNPGHDIGTVSLVGELIKVQMKKKGVAMDSEEIKKIYRKATQRDIDIWQAARDKEYETQYKGREILGRLGLKMKLSDVEYQGDGNKATFYYTADDRVDFRQLIRDLASAFSIRIEMKQVGLRQEAARLGGVGSCGRELCCSTWLTDLRKVNTTAARYQQLSLNPQKLAGQCGKLKCCLNYELDTYLDALKAFPKQEVILRTEKGNASFVKMDIFKGLFWYTYIENRSKWFKLTLEQVQEIIDLNKNGEKAISLEEYEADLVEETVADFENVVGQDSLTRFDAPKRNKRNKNKRRKKQAVGQNKPNPNQNKQKTRQPNQNPNQKKQGPGFKKPNPNQKNKPINPQQKTEGTGTVNQPNKKPNRNKKRRPPRKSADNKTNE